MRDQIAEILKEMEDLIKQKNRNYGNSYDITREEYGKLVFLIRLEDKINRLKTLINLSIEDESEMQGEAMEDTIKDIIGYCVLELNYVNTKSNKKGVNVKATRRNIVENEYADEL